MEYSAWYYSLLRFPKFCLQGFNILKIEIWTIDDIFFA